MSGTTIINYLEGPNGVTEKIKRAMYDAAKQFVYIGFLLWEVKEYKYYVTSGYKDIYDYAQQELGFKRTSTKNFIEIATVFGNRYYEPKGTIYSFCPTMNLKPEYEQFNYSQLVEMLSMSESKRKEVKPDMTIRQIREIKKEPEFELEPDVETIPLQLPESKNTEIDFDTLDQIIKVGQTSDRQLEYTITFDRAEWEIIIDNLEDNIRYNYGDPGEQEIMRSIVDTIKGVIKYNA